MKGCNIPLFVLFIATFPQTAACAEAFPSSPVINIRPLKDTSKGYSCSCQFWYKSKLAKGSHTSPIFLTGWQLRDSQAWINIDGLETTLDLTSANDPSVWKMDAKVSRHYTAADVSVLASFQQVGECRPNTECDAVPIRGNLLIHKFKSSRSLSVIGTCGC